MANFWRGAACIFLSVVATSLCVCVSGFQARHGRAFLSKAFTSSTLLVSKNADNELRSTELWLDLRGMAISPREALMFLASQEQDESWQEDTISFDPINVDRVLISTDAIDVALQLLEEETNVPVMMYANETDGSIRDVQDQSTLYGHAIQVTTNFIDPIPALVTVSNGGWVVVDSTEIKDEMDRKDVISSLYEFVSSGSSPSLLGGGLLLGGDDTPNEPFVTRPGEQSTSYGGDGEGGVAISCRTSTDVVNVAGLVQSTLVDGVVTTESGILLRQAPNEEIDASSKVKALHKSALLLPFDILIWKTAAIVFGNTE